ncbi:hypothetical protein BDF14DRAFT_1805016 [Spinellus fusiger]|nr:hypothetical protein BDF14DRAFT_1805016 [Spinellus fusiger]
MKSLLCLFLSIALDSMRSWIHAWIHVSATITAIIRVSSAVTQKQPYEHIMPRRHSLHSKRNYSITKKQSTSIRRLPNEVLMVVFEMLAVGRKRDLLNCTLVSKLWHDLVTPVLWRAPVPRQPICCLPQFMSLGTTTRSHSKPSHHCSLATNDRHHETTSHRLGNTFPIYLTKYGHAIRSLNLSNAAAHLTDCSVRHIVRYCPNLISIQLANCRHITNESLKFLARSVCAPHLRVLNIQNCLQISDSGLNFLAAECSSLETLQLGGCVRISNQGVTHLIKASSRTLRRLCLSDCSRVTGTTIYQIAKLCRTRLEWLDIARIGTVQHADLVGLLKYCPNLTRLNLARSKSILLRQLQEQRQEQRRHQYRRHSNEEDDFILSLMESPVNPLDELIEMLRRYNIQPTLTSFFSHNQRYENQYQRLVKQDDVSDVTLELIITQLPRLAHLDLSHWTCLTDTAICILSKHGSALTHLNLSGCKNITYRMFGYLSGLCHRNQKLTNITLNEVVAHGDTQEDHRTEEWIRNLVHAQRTNTTTSF